MDKVLVYHICCNDYVPFLDTLNIARNNFPSSECDTILMKCLIIIIKNAQIIMQHVHVAHYKFIVIIDNINLIF
jgi:hypothetical protein